MTKRTLTPPPNGDLDSRHILNVRVHATSYSDTVRRIGRWVHGEESRYVCACNVHMVMEAHDDSSFSEVVNGADLVTPDGMPLVWALRALGVQGATRVYGPRLMLHLCAAAERDRIRIGLYGSTQKVLRQLRTNLANAYPLLEIGYSHSPPFSVNADDTTELDRIAAARVRILFVALGCPRQEQWMARQRGRIDSVMVGVGAAFDFLAGTKPQAPRFLQSAGLEWAFRLASEPHRLWRRYALHNPRFAALFALQLIARKLTSTTVA